MDSSPTADTTSVIALRPGPPPIPTRQHNFVYKRKSRSPFVSLRNAPATPVFKTVTKHALLKRGPRNYPHRYDKENAVRAGFYGPKEGQCKELTRSLKLYRFVCVNITALSSPIKLPLDGGFKILHPR